MFSLQNFEPKIMSQRDHQPLPQSDDLGNIDHPSSQVSSSSLIHSESAQRDPKNGYSTYSDSDLHSLSDNPYKDTTESDINLRQLPLGDLIPRPWKTFEQVMLASYISAVIFLFTGLFAVRYARRGRRHQSKGLMGMAQKDLRLAVRLIYASAALGFILFFIVIPIAATA